MNSNILALVAFLGVASAAPQLQARSTVAVGDRFGLTAIHSGSEVHLQSFQAAKSLIATGMTFQNATCDSSLNYATFTLGDDGSLNLYSTEAPYQKAYVDASGMGQGVFGYTTGAQPMPTNGERAEFALDASDDLTFNGAGFIACPSTDGYSIWANTGAANPGGNTDCVGISVRATKIDAPVSCTYTQ